MEEKILGYISQYSEWAVGGSIETTSTNVKFYELDGLYYKLETSVNILGEKDSSEYEVEYTEIIEEFKEAMFILLLYGSVLFLIGSITQILSKNTRPEKKISQR